jgi:hypothetical protein
MFMFRAGNHASIPEEKCMVKEARFFAAASENFFTASAIRGYVHREGAIEQN